MDAPFHLPAPPTLEQRLDAAAETLRSVDAPFSTRNLPWAKAPEATKFYYRRLANDVCRAFAPEHFKDTDTTTGKD